MSSEDKSFFEKIIDEVKDNIPIENNTETTMAEFLGYKKIYDCGLIKYVWKKEK